MNQATKYFTPAQIARALGNKRQSVLWALRDVPADGQVIVNSTPVAAWKVSSLPPALQERLSEAAKRQGYANTEGLLSGPARLWDSPIPLSEVAQDCIDSAVELRRALAPSLARMDDATLSAAEFEERGVEDYARVFGHRISARYFRELLKRTLDRDRGNEEWGQAGNLS